MYDILVCFSSFLVTKSLSDAFLILGMITSSVCVDSFLVTVLSSVISDVFLFLLAIGSLALTTGFANHSVLLQISFLLCQDSFSVLCIIFFFCGRLFYRQPSGHFLTVDWSNSYLVWRLTNNDKTLASHMHSYKTRIATSGFNLFFFYFLFVITLVKYLHLH